GDDVDFDASVDLGHGIRLSTARQVLEAISQGNGPKNFIVALGYAGWEGGQLEREMSENTWLSCPATSEIIFETPFEQRVQRAAEALGIDFRLISNQPGHA
ncbi:MAG: YqgE/AlgH family protein, partial [Gammaproteobacteria bacterium]